MGLQAHYGHTKYTYGIRQNHGSHDLLLVECLGKKAPICIDCMLSSGTVTGILGELPTLNQEYRQTPLGPKPPFETQPQLAHFVGLGHHHRSTQLSSLSVCKVGCLGIQQFLTGKRRLRKKCIGLPIILTREPASL